MADSRLQPSDFEQDERPSGSSPQQILDITVQSCTVELFHALGVAIAPQPRSRSGAVVREHSDLVGTVPFGTTKGNGSLMVSLHPAVYALLTPPVAGGHAMHDALREITNQLIGRIKNRLMHFQVTLRVGLPSTLRKQLIAQKQPAVGQVEWYVFRTLRGEVIITIAGTIQNE